jgi:hypothetical protein
MPMTDPQMTMLPEKQVAMIQGICMHYVMRTLNEHGMFSRDLFKQMITDSPVDHDLLMLALCSDWQGEVRDDHNVFGEHRVDPVI